MIIRFECEKCRKTCSRSFEHEEPSLICKKCEANPPKQEPVSLGCFLIIWLVIFSPCLVILL